MHPLDARAAMGGMKREIGRGGTEYKVFHIHETAKRYVYPGYGGSIDIGEAYEAAWMEDAILGSQFGIDSKRH